MTFVLLTSALLAAFGIVGMTWVADTKRVRLAMISIAAIIVCISIGSLMIL